MAKKILRWFIDNAGILCVIGIALSLRIFGIGFGLPDEFHIDEAHIVPRAVRFGTGDLNPHWFFYPPLYMYALFVLYAAYFVIGRVAGMFGSAEAFAVQYFADPTMFYLIGRTLTAVLGAATVWLVYRFGARAWSRAAGMAAAILLALCALHVEHSHYITSDVPMTFLIMCALWAAYVYATGGRTRFLLAAGVLTGLAMAVKYTAVLAVPACALALVVRMLKAGKGDDEVQGPAPGLKGAVAAMFALGVGAAAGFTIGCPWWILDYGPFISDVRATAQNISGPWLGNENITNMWWHVIGVFLRQGMTLPLLIVCAAGLAWAAVRRRPADWIVGGFVILYYLWVAHYQTFGFARYWVAVLPGLCIVGGRLIADVADWLLGDNRERALQAAGMAALILAAASGVQGLRSDHEMSGENTRTMAKRWFHANVPAGTPVAVELHGPMLKPTRDALLRSAEQDPSEPGRVAETMKFDRLHDAKRPWAKKSLTNKKHHLAALEKEPFKYDLIMPFSLAEYTLDSYRQQKFQYLVASEAVYGRYFAAADRFPKAVAFYHRLERECPPEPGSDTCALVAVFHPVPGKHPGPVIKIYELKYKDREPGEPQQ